MTKIPLVTLHYYQCTAQTKSTLLMYARVNNLECGAYKSTRGGYTVFVKAPAVHTIHQIEMDKIYNINQKEVLQ